MSYYKDTNLVNMLKDLCPGVEIKIVREHRGVRVNPDKACFLVDGRLCWTRISELDNWRRKFGHAGVMHSLAEFLSGQTASPINTGAYDSVRYEEARKRKLGKMSEMLEFAMKSAGSSDQEIYQELKDA